MVNVHARGFAIVHDSVPGRLRIRAMALHRRPDLARSVEEACASAPGVRGTRASATTGSILISFDEEVDREQLFGLLEEVLSRALRGVPERSVFVRGVVASRAASKAKRHGNAEIDRVFRAAAARARQALSRSGGDGSSEGPGGFPPVAELPEGPAWHTLSCDEALARCDSVRSGLSVEAAGQRLQLHGPNALAPPKRPSPLALFFGQFASVPVALLGASAVLSAATGGLGDAVAISVVVLLNAAIGYTTESEAERTLSLLDGGGPQTARVVRDEAIVEIPARDIVPGDILVLSPGDLVAADGRLIQTERLMVDESSLTGESLPVEKIVVPLRDERVPLGDRLNMVYRGTTVSGGSGRAMVVATGPRTEIGHIQGLAGTIESRETPLQAQLRTLGFHLAVGSALVCGGVFGVGLLRGYRLVDMLKMSVSLAVAAVPEGLPTVAITTLAIGIRRMRRLDVIVRHLGAVETLGAVQVLCLDKTGTITQNRMTVVTVFAAGRAYALEDRAFLADGVRVTASEIEPLFRLLELVTLCSEVTFERDEAAPGNLKLSGSATETALVDAALAAGVDVAKAREEHPTRDIYYRTHARNYMYTVHGDPSPQLVAVKGRPTEVLALCDRFLGPAGEEPLDDEERFEIEMENERLAGRALRLLGVAYRRNGAGDLEAEGATPTDFVWVGLIGMVDPPRPGIADLLRRFHAAGIDTVMITGDQSATAQAIARQIGLKENGSLEILDSTRLDELEPDVLRSLSERVDIFSRVSPTHKLQIVQALQSAGRVVAMTGDGINDGPALKAADVGVALGESGTPAAREVADVVLTTDDLDAMITAVEQGRTIYDDIKKALHFILSTNLSEILVTFSSVVAGLGQPLTPMQLLWINILTDVFPELALAVQPPEEDVLARPPRMPDDPMFSPRDLRWLGIEGAIITTGAMATYGYAVARYGRGPRASTLAFTSLTSAQLLHAITSRSDAHTIFDKRHLAHNPYFRASVGGALGLQVLASLFPPLRSLLNMTRLGPGDWLITAAGATTPFFTNELIKLWRRAEPSERGRSSSPTSAPEPPPGARRVDDAT